MPERRRFDPLHLGTDEHPYSKGLMARALMRTGLGVAGAYEVARRVEQDLAATGKRTADFERMEELAIEVLGEPDGALTMGRLRRYQGLDETDMPLIMLIGGATGTGKSTVAAEVAYRLGITRVTSTDFVRQTMRALFTRVPARDPLLELRRRPRAANGARGGGRPAPPRVPRADATRSRRGPGGDRPVTRGGAGRWSSKAFIVPGMLRRPVGRERARRRLRDHDRERGARRTLLDPRHRVRGRPASGQVPRAPRRHPLSPGLHRRARTGGGGPGGRELGAGEGDRRRAGLVLAAADRVRVSS